MRVLIAAENASLNMSGEAALALYYFDRLRQRGIDVWLVCHARVRDELRERYSDEIFERIHFVKDTLLQTKLCDAIKQEPFKSYTPIIAQIVRLITQLNTRPIVQRLVKSFNIDLVFDPSVISPKSMSCLYGFGVPVVIGPMCGGIVFPPDFQYIEPLSKRLSIRLGRIFSQLANRIFPGKLEAAALIVANDRTAKALPKGYKGKVYTVVESGVDLSLWKPVERPERSPDQPMRFVYMARFVEQKGIPFLIEAFKPVAEQTNAILELIGSGELLEQTKAQVAAFNIQDQVNFYGWMQLQDAADLIRQCDVYLVPAIGDCGGCAMLEAMAIGMPVIAANWAGPGDYADETCGIRVDVNSRDEFVKGLTEAMLRLAKSPQLRDQLGEGSKQRVRSNYFDWDAKVDRVVEIFQEVLGLPHKKPIARTSNEISSRISAVRV
jgi:glycosyltransferase involved in cell wall biosynthesis